MLRRWLAVSSTRSESLPLPDQSEVSEKVLRYEAGGKSSEQVRKARRLGYSPRDCAVMAIRYVILEDCRSQPTGHIA